MQWHLSYFRCSQKILRGDQTGGDTFADDTNVNHSARINYTLLQKDLTVFQYWGKRWHKKQSISTDTSIRECVHTHSKSAHRLMSKNLAFPVTVGVMEFALRVL